MTSFALSNCSQSSKNDAAKKELETLKTKYDNLDKKYKSLSSQSTEEKTALKADLDELAINLAAAVEKEQANAELYAQNEADRKAIDSKSSELEAKENDLNSTFDKVVTELVNLNNQKVRLNNLLKQAQVDVVVNPGNSSIGLVDSIKTALDAIDTRLAQVTNKEQKMAAALAENAKLYSETAFWLTIESDLTDAPTTYMITVNGDFTFLENNKINSFVKTLNIVAISNDIVRRKIVTGFGGNKKSVTKYKGQARYLIAASQSDLDQMNQLKELSENIGDNTIFVRPVKDLNSGSSVIRVTFNDNKTKNIKLSANKINSNDIMELGQDFSRILLPVSIINSKSVNIETFKSIVKNGEIPSASKKVLHDILAKHVESYNAVQEGTRNFTSETNMFVKSIDLVMLLDGVNFSVSYPKTLLAEMTLKAEYIRYTKVEGDKVTYAVPNLKAVTVEQDKEISSNKIKKNSYYQDLRDFLK